MNILTSLIVYQGASVAMCVGTGIANAYVGGTLTITVAGAVHVLTVQRMTVADVLGALEAEYLHHDWTTAPVVEVHSGCAEAISRDIAAAKRNSLAKGICPACGSDLEYPWDIEDRFCPSCHYAWTKEDE